jgi:hypothetical protein
MLMMSRTCAVTNCNTITHITTVLSFLGDSVEYPSRSAEVVSLIMYIQEEPGLNLGWDTVYPDC